jgi:glucose/arabinose dehydrogenase
VPAAAQLDAEVWASGFNNPLGIVIDPTDGEHRTFFVVEQAGLIRVVRDGEILPEPLLDLRRDISSGGERGLLGLAFAPQLESRRFYVNFTNPRGDTVVARFTRNEQNPLAADANSRFDLVWPSGRSYIEQPFSNHNGGHLAFGPEDGCLYIGMGDGGSGGDPFNNAQNPQSLLGKMLRLDVNVPDDDPRGYRIPEGNPFVDGDPVEALWEIWAFGLRNPWQFSFDDPGRGGTGAMLIGDVGQNSREEINFEPRGASGRNYGWRLREGRRPFDARRPPAFTPLIDPILDYDRTQGASITGGYVYRGTELGDSYQGRYFYADFADGRVYSIGLRLSDSGEASAEDAREHTIDLGGRERLGTISAFGVDGSGELLIVNYSGGVIFRVRPDGGDEPAPAPVSRRPNPPRAN